MKRNLILSLLITSVSLFNFSCGSKSKSTDEKSEKIKAREINKSLDTLITNLAACEQQNTNCAAYSKASEGIQSLCSEESKRNEIVADLFYIIQTGPSKRTQAAAHAVNFWTKTSNFKDNAEYGNAVLDALKKEKFDQNSYTGSQLGQLLSKWFGTSDEKLLSAIVSAMKDKSVELRGRSELVRLSSYDDYSNKVVFDGLVEIIKNESEEESVREQALGVIWRAKDENMKKMVRTLFEDYINNANVKLAGPSLLGLSYMKSYESYNAMAKAIRSNNKDKNWYYYGSMALGNFVDSGSDSINKTAVFELIKEMLNNKEVEASYRTYYVSPLSKINNPASKALLNQLRNSNEKEIADAVKRLK
jgi:hypothetical protein